MSIKIKPSRPKLRRRGQKLILEDGEIKLISVPDYGNKKWQIIEYWKGKYHAHVTYSNDRRFAWFKGVHEEHGPFQSVASGGFWGEYVGLRQTDEQQWIFRGPGEDTYYVSISQIAIKNIALIAAHIEGELDADLAAFLGIEPTLCNAAAIAEIHASVRFQALREFDFRITPEKVSGKGWRAENAIRHEHSNYNEMLRDAGGLLWPEQYEVVRKGVDRLVRGHLREASK